jgi:hypothetical protein
MPCASTKYSAEPVVVVESETYSPSGVWHYMILRPSRWTIDPMPITLKP